MKTSLKIGSGTAEFVKGYNYYTWYLRNGNGIVINSGTAYTLRQCIIDVNFYARRLGWVV